MSGLDQDSRRTWERVLDGLRAKLGAEFPVWFKQAELAFVDGDEVGISLPTKFVRDYVERHYRDQVFDCWASEVPTLSEVVFVVRPAAPVVAAAPSQFQPSPADVFRLGQFPSMRMSDFVVGDSNQHAFDEVRRALGAPRGAETPPLFIYAPSGMGKTHLLLGGAAETQAPAPGYSPPAVTYIPADLFIMHAVHAAREERMRELRQASLSSDILLVDGLQLLEGKGWAADEMLLLIDHGVRSGKTVIMSANRAIEALGEIGERLNLIWARPISIDLGGSTAEIRGSIIARRSAAGAFQITEEAAELVAEHFHGSHRQMLDALTTAYNNARPARPLDKEDIRPLLPAAPERGPEVPLSRILQAVAQETGVSILDLKSSTRRAKVARARHIAMFLMRDLTSSTLREVGALFGGRDHSTVVNAVSVISMALPDDAETAQLVEAIREKLSSR